MATIRRGPAGTLHLGRLSLRVIRPQLTVICGTVCMVHNVNYTGSIWRLTVSCRVVWRTSHACWGTLCMTVTPWPTGWFAAGPVQYVWHGACGCHDEAGPAIVAPLSGVREAPLGTGPNVGSQFFGPAKWSLVAGA